MYLVMRFARPILFGVITVALAAYAFDCWAMATPEQATRSRSGLLQEHAHCARSFCAVLVCAWRVLLPRCTRSNAGIWRIPRLRFLRLQHCRALPRSAYLLLTGSRAYPNLV